MCNIEKCLKKCRLYNFNSRNGIRKLLNIPENIDLDNIRSEIDKYYDFFYIQKPTKQKKENKISKEERRAKYLSIENTIEILDKKPDDYSPDKYRMLININKPWLKKSLKKINKLLSNSLIKKENGKINYLVPYLHSSLKKRSYTTNVESHKNDKYIIAIDIKSFYPSIKYSKIINFFRYDLNLDKDIAEIFSALCTCPINIDKEITYGIGQGLSTSPILAYLSNYRMFDYLYELASKENINMTVYVDDVIFSSNKPINQKFINSLFGRIKKNDLKIKKNKVKMYKPNSIKKITGLYILPNNMVKVSKSKHEEVKVQYDYLLNEVLKIKNISDYFDFYNLFIKFKGNIQFINLVEGNVTKKHQDFIDEYNDYFIYGIKKKQKNLKYEKNNISRKDYSKVLLKYEKLRKKIDSIK